MSLVFPSHLNTAENPLILFSQWHITHSLWAIKEGALWEMSKVLSKCPVVWLPTSQNPSAEDTLDTIICAHIVKPSICQVLWFK